MNKRIIIRVIVVTNLLFGTLFLLGCSNKPYLTGDNSYSIHTIKATGEVETLPIVIPWNFNTAIMRNLLMESSFVLSDLRTSDPDELLKTSEDTIFLESIFPESRSMTLGIDQHDVTMDINSIQIEVKGPHVGRIILNQNLIFQGINNPNLQPTFENFAKILAANKREVRDQKPEVRDQRSETGGRFEFRGPNLKVRGSKSEVRGPKLNVEDNTLNLE